MHRGRQPVTGTWGLFSITFLMSFLSLSEEDSCHLSHTARKFPGPSAPFLQLSLWCERNCLPFLLLLSPPYLACITLSFCLCRQVPQRQLLTWMPHVPRGSQEALENLGLYLALVPLPWVPLMHSSYYYLPKGRSLLFDPP